MSCQLAVQSLSLILCIGWALSFLLLLYHGKSLRKPRLTHEHVIQKECKEAADTTIFRIKIFAGCCIIVFWNWEKSPYEQNNTAFSVANAMEYLVGRFMYRSFLFCKNSCLQFWLAYVGRIEAPHLLQLLAANCNAGILGTALFCLQVVACNSGKPMWLVFKKSSS